MKKVILFLLILLMILTACSPIYEYKTPKIKSCDFSDKNACESKGCRWKLLTDVANSDPMPATCCPSYVKINSSNFDEQDPCTWVIG